MITERFSHQKPMQPLAELKKDIEALKERIRTETRMALRARMQGELQMKVRKLVARMR